jgi:hypothetical protein
MGAIAAPIAANLRIDSSEVILFPTRVIPTVVERQPEPILLPSLDENLSWLSTELHWAPVLIFPGAPLGELMPGELVDDVPVNAKPPASRLSIGIPEPPAVVMTATGFGMGALMLRRQRGKGRVRRRRRLIFRLRAMAAIL